MKRVVVVASILSMLGSSAVFAQGMPDFHRPGTSYTQGHGPNPHQVYRHGRPQFHGKPAPYRSQWSRGKRLPANYRHNVVRDYGRYRLAPPPRGYNWVRVNNEYVLIGIASGLISSIVRAN